jgi:hypothetical protein
MASERQIAANRRNAQRSTGPRSASGAKRSSQNAYRHGLAKRISTVDFGKQLDMLARQIAGDADDEATLALARVAAEAQLDLARIRQLKKAVIESVTALGDPETSPFWRPEMEQIRSRSRGPSKLPWPDAIDPLTRMPDPLELTPYLLSDCVKLLRYENRAAGRRNKAIRKLSQSGQQWPQESDHSKGGN